MDELQAFEQSMLQAMPQVDRMLREEEETMDAITRIHPDLADYLGEMMAELREVTSTPPGSGTLTSMTEHLRKLLQEQEQLTANLRTKYTENATALQGLTIEIANIKEEIDQIEAQKQTCLSEMHDKNNVPLVLKLMRSRSIWQQSTNNVATVETNAT